MENHFQNNNHKAFEFKPLEDLNSVSIIVNNECQKLLDKHSLYSAIKNLEHLYNDCKSKYPELINLIDTEIPLFAYYELRLFGKDNWSMTENTYHNALCNCKDKCFEYYDIKEYNNDIEDEYGYCYGDDNVDYNQKESPSLIYAQHTRNEKLNIYQIRYFCSCISVLAESHDEAVHLAFDKNDEKIEIIGDKYYVDNMQIFIEEIVDKGVFQWESH